MKMNRYLIMVFAGLGVFASLTEIHADDSEINTNTDNSIYTVTIPSEIVIDSSTGKGIIGVGGTLSPYADLSISISDENWEHRKLTNHNDSLEYSLDKQNIYFNPSEDGTPINGSFSMELKTDQNPKYAGLYSDTITFDISGSRQKFTLSFDANGGLTTESSRELTCGSPYGQLPTPARDGYTFDGWYTSKEGGKAVSETSLMNGENATVYAHWIGKSYTLNFDNNQKHDNGASGNIASGIYIYGKTDLPDGSAYTAPAEARFLGWNTESDGSGISYEKNTPIQGTAPANREITLYAQWGYPQTVSLEQETADSTDTVPKYESPVSLNTAQYLTKGSTFEWSTDSLDWSATDKKCYQTTSVSYEVDGKKDNILKINRKLYYLDLNANWYNENREYVTGGGNLKWDGVITATAQVFVNDVEMTQQGAGTDYFRQHRYGSTFKFVITMQPGYKLIGFEIGDHQGSSKVTWDNNNTITGIVTGERTDIHSKKDDGTESVYDATTIALKIQKDRSTTENSYDDTTPEQNLLDVEAVTLEMKEIDSLSASDMESADSITACELSDDEMQMAESEETKESDLSETMKNDHAEEVIHNISDEITDNLHGEVFISEFDDSEITEESEQVQE